MTDWIQRAWQQGHPLLWLLLPFNLLFIAIATLRKWAFALGLKKQQKLPVPVIVVGNLSVGGNGKTPVVLHLVELLARQGRRVGVISRGYGGQSDSWPQWVDANSTPRQVGDEPCLIVQRTGVPMAVGPDRIAAAKLLLERAQVDVIVSDDGLQHYRLGRDIELVVVDGERRFGNGFRLPMGPLREPKGRLKSVDAIICNGGQAPSGEFAMTLSPSALTAVDGGAQQPDLTQGAVAMAGIGNPPRFFEALTQQGITLNSQHGFGDHHPFTESELGQLAQAPVPLLMTEKDAVKCRSFAKAHWFYLPVTANLSEEFDRLLLSRLKEIDHGVRH
ncbi:tetraacyldisaccharide 4'-kinase [Ferrimonas aestuarii]|uniref:Tetraacyldisaccharide 4'-kinase n=1 Tax=Ferrimonas aestuarii TaxID=2569539 RepID=A0A4U1BVP1_9GAMM|nr:tetraacyldisaccharide 4'-kinase [Ferrimonas aestuarii]TKB58534.1 tetraacyldisaccharide 4'-kinase [Ferrimonas aestuarii]